MSFINKMKSGSRELLPPRSGSGINGHGLIGFIVDKSERYVGSFAFGAAKGYYGDQFLFKGEGCDLWIGAGLTLLGAVLNAASHGRSSIAPHLERFGDSGVQANLHSRGVGYGAQKAGRVAHVMSPALPARQSVVGYIPQAHGGAFLNANDIARHRSAR